MKSCQVLQVVVALFPLVFANPIEKKSIGFSITEVDSGVPRKRPAAAIAHAYKKFGQAPPSHIIAAAAKQTGHVQATPQNDDSEYYAPVSIGGQSFFLDFDTGSSDVWVFSAKQPSSETAGRSVYKCSNPSFNDESWSITYGDSSGASGVVVKDEVVIGGVTATSAAVECATSASASFVQDTTVDGLLGLGFRVGNQAHPNQVTPWFGIVKDTLPQPLFTATLKKGAGGEYDFGYIDSSKFTGSIAYTPIDKSQGYWEFTADGFSVGSGAKTTSSQTSIADTGTTLVLVDDTILNAYYSQVSGATDDAEAGGYVYSCDTTLPDFNLFIGGEMRSIPGSDITYENTGSSCFGGIQSNKGLPFNIFGDVFLKSQFAVFDHDGPKIGFAQQA